MDTSISRAASDSRLSTHAGTAVWTYLGLVTVAEVLVVLVSPVAGIVFHAALLAALLVHAAISDSADMNRLLLPLALAPLTRILSLSMPLSILPQIYWYPVIYAPLAIGAVLVMRQLNLSLDDVGLNVRKPLLQALVVPLGVLLGVTEYLILRPSGLEAQLTGFTVASSATIFILTTGLVEEWVFRGVLQKVMKDRFGWVGVVYAGLLFAVLHLGFLSVVDLVFVFAVAVLFSWIVNKTGSLLGVTLAHGMTNFSLYVVLPLVLG